PLLATSPASCRMRAGCFFYDGGVGPWHDGTESCRVIWNRTPAAQLERKPIRRALVDLHVEFYTALRPGAPVPDPPAIDASTPSHHWAPRAPCGCDRNCGRRRA